MAWILVLDRGTSSLKAALFDSGKIIGRWREPVAHPEETLRRIALESVLAAIPFKKSGLPQKDVQRSLRVIADSATFHRVVFSSVDTRWTREIRRVLGRMGSSRVLEVSAKTAFPFEILVKKPGKVGPDRLAAAAGVVASGGREGIIVDAGTAITVDILSKKGFLGGAILPGRDLMYRALHEGTSALPLVSDSCRAIEPPGRDTKEAIITGAEWGVVGAVKELVDRSRRHVSNRAAVWVTGGGGAPIASHLGTGARYESDLVFLGLHYLFELNVD